MPALNKPLSPRVFAVADPSTSTPFGVAPTTILTPATLRARELARARSECGTNESPALRELRAFLLRQ